MAATPGFSDYAFVAIGANLPSGAGDPLDTIGAAFDSLAALSIAPVLKSSVYLTSPVDSPAGTPDFYNALAGIVPDAGETPVSLLHKLQAIENEAGRTRSGIRNEARTLDLDLITYKSEIVSTDELTLPHPRAQDRKFVLVPLMEIVGEDFRFPGMIEPVRILYSRIAGKQTLRKL